LAQAILSARGEATLFLASVAAIVGTFMSHKTEDPAGIAWALALAVMALPHGAAIAVAIMSAARRPSAAQLQPA
jgi:zinc transporter ZupT